MINNSSNTFEAWDKIDQYIKEIESLTYKLQKGIIDIQDYYEAQSNISANASMIVIDQMMSCYLDGDERYALYTYRPIAMNILAGCKVDTHLRKEARQKMMDFDNMVLRKNKIKKLPYIPCAVIAILVSLIIIMVTK